MTKSRPGWFVGFALVIAFAWLDVLPARATAAVAQDQCLNLDNYFTGFGHDPTQRSEAFEGASGYITLSRQPSTCKSDPGSPNPSTRRTSNNFTTSWVMIADYDGSDWSQVGIIAGNNEQPYFWAEFVRGYDRRTHGTIERYDRFLPQSPVIGSRYAFYERYSSNCPPPTNAGCIGSYVDDRRVTDTDFNPFATSTWNGGGDNPPCWSPQYFGEKMYDTSDIMGTPGGHTQFDYIGAQLPNGQFINEPCTLISVASAGAAARVGDI